MSIILPVALTVILFLWEGARYLSAGTFIVPIMGLAGMLALLRFLPLRQISLRQAVQIYAWFLFVSASVAYLDYEVMTHQGLWFSDRDQNDPAKYYEAVETDTESLHFNDPGFEVLLQFCWQLLAVFGQPTYLGLLNCVMILSSVFAVCCLEVASYFTKSARALPYLFVFNPWVVSFNSMLLRDILIGAMGWTTVLFGVAFLSKKRRWIHTDMWLAAGFVVGCIATYFQRSVSGAFFALVGIAIAMTYRQKITKLYAGIMVLGIIWMGSMIGEHLLNRSMSFVEKAMDQQMRIDKSVGSLVASGGLPFRFSLTIGGTLVYGLPFWRAGWSPDVHAWLFCFGSLFAQLFTALPLLIGMLLLARRPNMLGYTAFAIYFGWCLCSSLMMQNHSRYITSHLLPIIIAISAVGWDAVWNRHNSNGYLYHATLFLFFLLMQIAIEILKLQL